MAVEQTDEISRFIYNNDYSTARMKAKPRAFERRPGDRELSCFLTQGLSPDQAMQIGRVARTDNTLKARASFAAELPLSLGLTVVLDNDPPRHVSLVDWPDDYEKQVEIKAKLANGATLVLASQ